MISRDFRRKFGQNYLSDPAIIFEMGQAISPQTNSNFFEIGPGMGALTNVLNQDGISIKAVDIDKNNIDYLSKNLLVLQNLNFFKEISCPRH
jgi:16S rRNA (adenine1518-N6/adenine1519-N6)-dimethyltransferase